jgi:cobalt-precorrin 5A hydrolase/precorrin-3B C17-methyltransferase
MNSSNPQDIAIVVISRSGMITAEKIKEISGGQIHGFSRRIDQCDRSFDHVAQHLCSLFESGKTIIAIMATGAVVRCLAHLLNDKHKEPPVVAISEDGSSVVPILGGHHGANQICRFLAENLGSHAAITTSGDVIFNVALDEPPEGYMLANPENAKLVMAELLEGKSAVLSGRAPWLKDSKLPFAAYGTVRLTVSDKTAVPRSLELVYHPKTLALGIGCERGTDPQEAIELVIATLAKSGLAPESIAVVVSIDLKADEVAVHAVGDHFGVPVRFFTAEVLEAEAERLATPSDVVFAETGCHGVAEGAALVAGGKSSELIVPKQKSKRATASIARVVTPIISTEFGRARGHLSVVGIGPGNKYWRSPEVSSLIGQATDLVGYSLYLNLLEGLADKKNRHDFDLGREEDRVRHAMELAGKGRNVALVCSGDAGIYAMATLVFELLEHGQLSDAASRISIQVSPGISALQAAAARAGAPLGHDFCTISLSDLLTPWEMIKKRVKTAAEGDFVIAFYNPVSKRRRVQLAHAKDVLLEHRPKDTPVILATNLGRDGENVRIVPLADLDINEVNMLTVVVVGSSESRVIRTGDGQKWVYTPRGYAAKPGTMIEGKIGIEEKVKQ